MREIGLSITSEESDAIAGVHRVETAVRGVGNEATKTAAKSKQMSSALAEAKQQAIGFVAAFAGLRGLQAIINVTDQHANLQAKIKIATRSQVEFAAANKATYEISQRTFTSLEATVTLYTRLTSSLRQFGVTQERVAGLTETINKALTVSGASAAESSSAILQLSQAFGAGRLAGEEFNAVNEAAPLLMEKLAAALGVPRGQLKKLAADGVLTTQVLAAAFEEQAASINASFAQVPITTTRALTQMQNAATVAFGKLFGDGNRGLAEFISFFVPIMESLPEYVEIATYNIVELFRLAWQSILTYAALIVPGAKQTWNDLTEGAREGADAIQLLYAVALDAVQKAFAALVGAIGSALSELGGPLGSVAGKGLELLSQSIAATATNTATATAEIQKNTVARNDQEKAIQAEIEAILAKDEAAKTEIRSLEMAYAATRAQTAAVEAAATAAGDEAEGHRKTAKELLAEAQAAAKSTGAKNAHTAAAKKAFDIASADLKLLRDLINAELKQTAAKDQAKKVLEGIIPAIEKAYALDGLTIEQRRIAEAGIKAETFAREQLAKVVKGGLGLSESEQAAIRAEAKARGEALEAAQIQTEAATEANKQAAEEYRRQWEQAFDDIVDAALEGGDALQNVVRNYLKDIVKQFAKKIILDVVTRYSKQGSKDNGDDEEPTTYERAVQGFAGAVGVRDAFRSGDPLSGAASGAALGSAILPGIGTIIGGIVGALAGLFGGPSKPDLRLGAAGVTRKPEQTFATAFGSQQIGVRGGTDTQQFITLVTDFDKTIAGIVGSFGNGTQQLEAVQNRLRTWSVDLKGDAITTEAVLGSRFNAILSTFNADIQAFVGTLGTTAERAQRLQDAAFIEGASKVSILASTFNDLARILTDNKIAGESVAQTYERVSASVEILRAALSISGVEITQSGDALIKFASDIATAAGGTQQAAALWNTYFETFYDAEERAQSAVAQASQARKDALAAIGLEATTSGEQFRAAFEAALPTLSPEQVVLYLRAGAAIGALDQAESELLAARYEISQDLQAIADSEQAAADKITDSLRGLLTITEQIDAGFTAVTRSVFSDFANSLLTIDDTMRANIRTLTEQRAAAVLAGASSEQLAGYDLQLGRAHLLAAAQAAAAIAQLTKAGRSLVAQLKLSVGGARYLADQGTNAFREIGDAANQVYESQLAALKSLKEYLDSQLLGNLTALTPAEQFAEAQRQLAAAIAAGMAGDPEAIRRAQQLADVVLRLGRDRFASGQQFTDLEASIRAALSGLLNIPLNGPTGATGGTGEAIGNLADDLGAQTDENRAQLLAQLTEIIRELVGATGLSLSEIASSLSLDLTAFVQSLGVNLEALTATSAASLADIARNLGVELGELAENVGVDLGQLADDQSLLNDALESVISGLPEGQRDELQPLLDAVEAAADDPEGLAIAKAALIDAIQGGGPELANLLAPYFDEIDPINPLYGIDNTLRGGFADVVRAINQWQAAPPAAPPAATTPPAFSNSNTYAPASGGTPEFRALGAIAGRLASIENTIQRGDRANMAATYNSGNKQAAAIDRSARANNAGRLVMSE